MEARASVRDHVGEILLEGFTTMFVNYRASWIRRSLLLLLLGYPPSQYKTGASDLEGVGRYKSRPGSREQLRIQDLCPYQAV